jgi:hypothetical protein
VEETRFSRPGDAIFLAWTSKIGVQHFMPSIIIIIIIIIAERHCDAIVIEQLQGR